MEKRLVAFMLSSMLVLMGYFLLVQTMTPPRDMADVDLMGQEADQLALPDPRIPAAAGEDIAAPAPLAGEQQQGAAAEEASAQAVADEGQEPAAGPNPQRWVVLGSANPDSGYRMLVYLTSRGAAIERATLNSPKYLDLNVDLGYFGALLADDQGPQAGCRIRCVGPNTPAARATGGKGPAGLRGQRVELGGDGQPLVIPGDLIQRVGDRPVSTTAEFESVLSQHKPGEVIPIVIQRTAPGGQTSQHTYEVTLGQKPLDVLDQRRLDAAEPIPSYLFSLVQVGQTQAGFGEAELAQLPSLREADWTTEKFADDAGEGVEFRLRLSDVQLKSIAAGPLEFVKRFRLDKVAEDEQDNPDAPGYHISLDWEIRNLSAQPQTVAYRIDGPTGLPMEGWWYSYKTHPTSFSAAGARDVVFAVEDGKIELFSCSKLVEQRKKNPDSPEVRLFTGEQRAPLRFLGTDTQYFSSLLVPPVGASEDARFQDVKRDLFFDKIVAETVGPLDELSDSKRTDVTFHATSKPKTIEPRGVFEQRFRVFIGPKKDNLLAHYNAEDVIVYGWFGAISKPMLAILHFFNRIVSNYGIAIVLLTVLVRGCMFPLGRKMALNAQKMQELAPEMRKIADKYKNDMEKRTQAQRELFQKHNYNPLAGCLVMFIQLPIFVGLYRGLSVDIELRQAPLIPGISWCSNLAGPDMFLDWSNFLPSALSSPTGWLGPYLNILPLVTCVLFMVHQKLFTPPPTDDQQRMQQQIMKFMMLFMAVLFHKVAAGLCVYFIASSIWGLCERLMLPKATAGSNGNLPPSSPRGGDGGIRPQKSPPGAGGNGTKGDRNKKKRLKQRRDDDARRKKRQKS